MHFPGEDLLSGWDDASDVDQVGLRVLQHGSLTVVLSYTGLGTWDVVALKNGRVVKANWRDGDVAFNLTQLTRD